MKTYFLGVEITSTITWKFSPAEPKEIKKSAIAKSGNDPWDSGTFSASDSTTFSSFVFRDKNDLSPFFDFVSFSSVETLKYAGLR